MPWPGARLAREGAFTALGGRPAVGSLNGWLTLLVHELSEGREPIFSLAEIRNVARTAVLDERGQFLASDLGSDAVERAVSWQAIALKSGQTAALDVCGIKVVSEKVTQGTFPFWKEAIKGRDEAWASWLVTMTQRGDVSKGGPDPQAGSGPEAGLDTEAGSDLAVGLGSDARPSSEAGAGSAIKVTRHILSALGPFTKPRLPSEAEFSLLHLNTGLGRLFVFGDDDLALECAAIAARAGLKATLVSANSLELDLRSAQLVGYFELRPLSDWSEVTEETLAEMGFKPGVTVLATTPQVTGFLDTVKGFKIGWLGLAGEAAGQETEPGLFPLATTASLKALGLVAAILDRR